MRDRNRAWFLIAGSLVVGASPAVASGDGGPPCLFLLVFDEDTLDNGNSTVETAASALGVAAAELVNDDNPVVMGNPPLRWSKQWSCMDGGAESCEVTLPSGRLCDEGVFVLPLVVPWPVADFVAGTVPPGELDEIGGVTPLHTAELLALNGRSCVAVVYDNDISINYTALNGNLQGGRYGLFFFTVLGLIPPGTIPESASSTSQWDLLIRVDPAPPDLNGDGQLNLDDFCVELLTFPLGDACNSGEFVPGQAIVELVPDATIDDINADYGTVVIASIESQNTHLVGLPEGVDELLYEQVFQADPRVEHAEVNYENQTPEGVGGDTQPFFFYVPPADYVDQYALDLITLSPAQQVATGSGVVVAVLDTGVDASHEAVAGKILPDGFNFVDGNTDVADVGNGIDDDGDTLIDEMVGHGTCVAGIIAIVAPDADILPVKVLDSEGRGPSFRVAQGIYYAVEQGAHVINLSLGSANENHVVTGAVAYARDAGVAVVASAGNLSLELPVQFPAADVNVIGVAATDANDLKSEFSNYGAHISLSAPGSEIVSAMPGNAYAEASGTSLAAALVSGAVALIKASTPYATPTQIELMLYWGADDLDGLNPEYQGQLGTGRLNVAGAVVGWPMGPGVPPPGLGGRGVELGPVPIRMGGN